MRREQKEGFPSSYRSEGSSSPGLLVSPLSQMLLEGLCPLRGCDTTETNDPHSWRVQMISECRFKTCPVKTKSSVNEWTL